MSLMEEINNRALALGIPLSVHFDLTYRCNERCEHCYLDHDDKGELSTSEVHDLIGQLAGAGVFFLTLSGGEPLLRDDCFDIIETARSYQLNVKLKTNGILIREAEARRLRALGVEQVQISVYSHRPEVHDGITKVPGSLQRTLNSIRFLKSQGLKVTIANVMMRKNLQDSDRVHDLAKELGVNFTVDPTITPRMDGNTDLLRLRIPSEDLKNVFQNSRLVGNVEEFCAPPKPVDDSIQEGLPCSAGHTMCYISPYGDLFPCVQFPLPSGNIRLEKFSDIWRNSQQLREVRSIHARDLPVCSSCSHLGTCTRCPGLAYMEGNMRGHSTADCEKSLARTGIVPASMLLQPMMEQNLNFRVFPPTP